MSKVCKVNPSDQVLAFVAPGLPRRGANKVVTRRGKRVRGNFPSLKATCSARFQSLGEERTWGVFELARAVESFVTHPASFRIDVDDEDGGFRYTPDCAITTHWRETLLGEVKPDTKFVRPDVRERLHRVWRAFEEEGTQFFVVLESDLLWVPGLLNLIEIALRNRPWRLNWIECRDEASAAEAEQNFDQAAWNRAAIACDELLERVMARDFRQTLKQAQDFTHA